MHPVICYLGPLSLHSYGVMLALGVFVAAWLTARVAAQKLGLSRDVVYDLVFWVVIGGLFGARLFFVFLNWDYFLSDPTEAFMIWNGGLAWQGSFLGGFLVYLIFAARRRVPGWKFLDIAMPYVALGHAIGRIGCLLNGCCYGKPAAWGIRFPFSDLPLHPTQIYMSLGQVAIFLVLRAGASRAGRDGQVFVWYLMLSSLERFTVEFFRDDHVLYAGFSIFQYICLALFAAALLVHLRLNAPRPS